MRWFAFKLSKRRHKLVSNSHLHLVCKWLRICLRRVFHTLLIRWEARCLRIMPLLPLFKLRDMLLVVYLWEVWFRVRVGNSGNRGTFLLSSMRRRLVSRHQLLFWQRVWTMLWSTSRLWISIVRHWHRLMHVMQGWIRILYLPRLWY